MIVSYIHVFSFCMCAFFKLLFCWEVLLRGCAAFWVLFIRVKVSCFFGLFFSLFSVFMCCSGMMSQRQVAAGLSRGKCFRKEKHSDADSPLKYDDEQLEAH